MNNKQKFIYSVALGTFTAEIVFKLYIGGDILWPGIGMMWCLSSLFNEISLNKFKNNQ